jgi:glycosyltransferase involved in cell wall biosynthesis
MRIALIHLTRGEISGGAQIYLKKILPLWEQHPGMESVNVYISSWINESLHSSAKIKLISLPDARNNISTLPKDIKDSNPDVVLVPTARWYNMGSIPYVTMINNMLPLVAPIRNNGIVLIILNLMRAYFMKQSCRKADKIIAVSWFVKNFLVERWKIPEEKIEVIYHGIEKPAKPGTLIPPPEIPGGFREDFIFTAGAIWPYRGLEDLLEALGILKQSGIDKKLVIAGGVYARKYKKRLDRIVRQYGIKDQIYWAGNINAEQMSWYYFNCSAFIMTSRVEACPITVLEAMAHACFCISTESSPMPEFFSETAWYYPPRNASALADQLKKADSLSIEEKTRLKEQAQIRSRDFTWEKCADATMELLMKTQKV